MVTFKIEKNKNYTVMSNYHLQDKNLTYKVKGLLSFMLSLPDDWDYTMAGLVKISKESIKSIRTALQELEDNKYLIRTRMKKENGWFYYDYSIYEIPYDITPYYQKGYAVSGHAQEDTQISTNITNTKEQINKINKDNKKELSFFYGKNFNPLTINLVNKGYIEKNDIQIFYYDKMYNQFLEDDNSYEDLLIISDYVIKKVKDRDFKNEEGEIIENKFGYLKESINANIRKMNVDLDDLWELD